MVGHITVPLVGVCLLLVGGYLWLRRFSRHEELSLHASDQAVGTQVSFMPPHFFNEARNSRASRHALWFLQEHRLCLRHTQSRPHCPFQRFPSQCPLASTCTFTTFDGSEGMTCGKAMPILSTYTGLHGLEVDSPVARRGPRHCRRAFQVLGFVAVVVVVVCR